MLRTSKRGTACSRLSVNRAAISLTFSRVSALIGVAMPVNRWDFAEVVDSAKPKFFIHGERDEICPLKEVREFYARAREPKELVVIDAADHLFDGRVGEVADAIDDLLGDFDSR